jgi:LysM repeat protein
MNFKLKKYNMIDFNKILSFKNNSKFKIHNLKFIFLFITSSTLLCSPLLANIQDSIGVEKKDGKAFVLHQVDAKETLYSISKKYSSKVEDIKAANPEIGDGIKIGQIIRVPYKGVVQNLPGTSPTTDAKPQTGKVHKVEAKETLYGIAKKYNVSVDDIKKANPELMDGLKTGMEIVIPGTKTSVAPTANPQTVVVKEKVKEEDKQDPIVAPSQNLPKGEFKKVTENGMAELLESKTDAPKFQALHKKAPVGTIIQVVNESNGQKIFVRVIGKLTDGSDDKIIIKISQKAMERLDAKDKKVAVALTYIP